VLGHNRVFGGYHDASGLIHEQRSKRVISILSGADCELDGLPDEFHGLDSRPNRFVLAIAPMTGVTRYAAAQLSMQQFGETCGDLSFASIFYLLLP
jgi:hypothetical protein